MVGGAVVVVVVAGLGPNGMGALVVVVVGGFVAVSEEPAPVDAAVVPAVVVVPGDGAPLVPASVAAF